MDIDYKVFLQVGAPITSLISFLQRSTNQSENLNWVYINTSPHFLTIRYLFPPEPFLPQPVSAPPPLSIPLSPGVIESGSSSPFDVRFSFRGDPVTSLHRRRSRRISNDRSSSLQNLYPSLQGVIERGSLSRPAFYILIMASQSPSSPSI